MALFSFSACNGILSGIYDDPPVIKDFGFIEVDNKTNSGRIYIDTRAYEKWVYIDFHAHEIDSMMISDDMSDPAQWDIAVHRYDTKTNGATVLETSFANLSDLRASGKLPEGTYIADEMTMEKIAIDMSGMMEGNIVYAKSYYNTELSKWLFVDTSGMPPSYNPSNKVYVIKLKDNTSAAVRLINFRDATNNTGFMTIDYIYPLNF